MNPTPSSPLQSDPVVIASVARTPMGSMLGDFASLAAYDLGAVAIAEALQRAALLPNMSMKSSWVVA